MDELEVMNRATEALNNAIFGLQIMAAGVALIRLGYDAGVKRGWSDKASTCGEGECRSTASPRPSV
jgi:hypothetical protein